MRRGLVDSTSHRTVGKAISLRERYAEVFEGMSDGVVLQDGTGHVLQVNDTARPLRVDTVAWATDASQGLGWDHPDHPSMLTLRSGRMQQRIPITLTDPVTGRPVHALLTVLPLMQDCGAPAGVLSFIVDDGERVARDETTRRDEECFRLAVEQTPIGFALLDIHGRVRRSNPALGRFLGLPDDALTGRPLQDWVHEDDMPTLTEQVRAMLRGRSGRLDAEVRWARADGQTVWGQVTGALTDPLTEPFREVGSGADRQLVVQIQDTTRYRQAQELLAHLTVHDPLTGQPNRTLLLDRTQKALDRARRGGGGLAILMCDIDRLKVVNDSLGHRAGDTVLVEVGNRISAALRGSDTAGRLGGDQFVVVCEDLRDEHEAVTIAERLLAMLHEPIPVDGRSVIATLSIGIALAAGTDTDTDPIQLLREAGAAVRRAKDAGRNTWEIADPEVRNRAIDRLDLEQSLRRSIARGQLSLHFQPIVDLVTRRRIGHEALLRWRHPERGLLSPVDFLHIAEESGLIVDIGRWVIQHAATVVAAAGPDAGYVSVNVSALQLGRPGLLATVRDALEDSRLAPDRLVLELTESVMLSAAPAARHELARLDELGTRLVVDDFGTGFSALSYLRDLPIRGIKIDRSFTAGLGESHHCERIVEAVTGLGRGLGVDVVVEGVETEAQRTALQEIGAPHAQGFLFGRPEPGLAA